MKPSTCKGCPYYESGGDTFVRDTVNPQAEAHILLRQPTYQALKTGSADYSDYLKSLKLTGLQEFSCGHMVRCKAPTKPRGNTIAWENRLYAAARHCSQYDNFPDVPIIGVSKEVWNFHTHKPGEEKYDIYKWRGFRAEIEVRDV